MDRKWWILIFSLHKAQNRCSLLVGIYVCVFRSDFFNLWIYYFQHMVSKVIVCICLKLAEEYEWLSMGSF